MNRGAFAWPPVVVRPLSLRVCGHDGYSAAVESDRPFRCPICGVSFADGRPAP